MRRIAIALALLVTAVLPSTAFAAGCRLDVRDIVSTSPFFTGQMTAVERGGAPDSVAFAHRDDPRLVAVFTVAAQTDDVSDYSRSDYVRKIEDKAARFTGMVKGRGLNPESSVFPYDPVAWRTVHRETVDGVGPARVSHMEIQITPDCLFVADAVAPDSINLTSRWADLQTAIVSIRDTARRYVVGSSFRPDRTIPTGATAIGVGVGLPVLVIAVLYLLMGQMTNLDPPETTTRIVLACSAAVAFGAAFVQRSAYLEGWDELKYVDGGILLAIIGVAALSGAFMAQRCALAGLLFTLVGGITLAIESFLDWTPDRNVTWPLAAALGVLGLSGFYAWSEASSSARMRRAGGDLRDGEVRASAQPRERT